MFKVIGMIGACGKIHLTCGNDDPSCSARKDQPVGDTVHSLAGDYLGAKYLRFTMTGVSQAMREDDSSTVRASCRNDNALQSCSGHFAVSRVASS